MEHGRKRRIEAVVSGAKGAIGRIRFLLGGKDARLRDAGDRLRKTVKEPDADACRRSRAECCRRVG